MPCFFFRKVRELKEEDDVGLLLCLLSDNDFL